MSVGSAESTTLPELTTREIAILTGGDPDVATTADAEGGDGSEEGQVETESASDATNSDALSQAEDEPEFVEDDGETEDASPEWVTDEIKDLAAGYALDDRDLELFGSEAEFRRQLRLTDSFTPIGRGEPKDGQESGKDAAPAGGANVGARGTSGGGGEGDGGKEAASPDIPEIDLAQFDDYDEPTKQVVSVVKALQEQNRQLQQQLQGFQGQFQTMEQQASARQQQQYFDQFHDLADAQDERIYGRSLVDGRPAELSEEANGARRQVFEAMEGIAAQFQRAGREVPPMRALFARAQEVVHGEKLRSLREGERRETVKAQAKKRRPSSAGRQKAVSDDFDGPPHDHPAIRAFWEQAQQDNGDA